MKQTYTPRERILNAFGHVQSDRIPIDLGSSPNTSITEDAYERLKAHFGIDLPTTLVSKNLSTAFMDDAVLERLPVDTRGVFTGANDEWRDIEISADKYINEWGITYYRPPNTPFFDAVENPLAGEITSKTLKEYSWPDPHKKSRVRGIRERVRYLREHTDYAVVLSPMGGFITQSQYLRGFQQWLEDLLVEPELVGELLDYTMQYQLDLTMDALAECDSDIDVVHYGDDLGIQTGLMFSPQTYRQVIKPRQAKLFAAVKTNSKAKILYHTCGCNYDILDDLIEIGVDALNPVQTNAKNMQADKLKREFGDRLTFWGAVSTYAPHGITEEVRRVVEVMAPGGGFVLNPIHNIQPNVSTEKILELFDAALKYGSL